MQMFFSYNNFFYIIKSNDFEHLADYSIATSKEFVLMVQIGSHMNQLHQISSNVAIKQSCLQADSPKAFV